MPQKSDSGYRVKFDNQTLGSSGNRGKLFGYQGNLSTLIAGRFIQLSRGIRRSVIEGNPTFGYRGIGYRNWVFGISITERSVIEGLLYKVVAKLPSYLRKYQQLFRNRLKSLCYQQSLRNYLFLLKLYLIRSKITQSFKKMARLILIQLKLFNLAFVHVHFIILLIELRA